MMEFAAMLIGLFCTSPAPPAAASDNEMGAAPGAALYAEIDEALRVRVSFKIHSLVMCF